MPDCLITQEVAAGFPLASFSATIFLCSANLIMVSLSISTPVLPGMSYIINGRSVALAIAVKCAAIPACGGLL
ncbi:unannotated protein [freshwater metagenome]|uniref:Unannotated protein n=1 Tax=freshwater metagenome TaxID=449393 RepID=A0A6J6EU29_9ZZZZ